MGAPPLAAFFYDPSPDFGANPVPFVVLMAGGIGHCGGGTHRAGPVAVALGIGLIFLATFFLPLLVNLSRSSGTWSPTSGR